MRIAATIAILLLLASTGCQQQQVSLRTWQDSVENYVWDQANGDPSARNAAINTRNASRFAPNRAAFTSSFVANTFSNFKSSAIAPSNKKHVSLAS